MLRSVPVRASARRSWMSRRRVQLVGASLVAALLPFLYRSYFYRGTGGDMRSLNAFVGNIAAVIMALWIR